MARALHEQSLIVSNKTKKINSNLNYKHTEILARELVFVPAKHKWPKKGSLHAVNDCFRIIYNTAGVENRLVQRSHTKLVFIFKTKENPLLIPPLYNKNKGRHYLLQITSPEKTC